MAGTTKTQPGKMNDTLIGEYVEIMSAQNPLFTLSEGEVKAFTEHGIITSDTARGIEYRYFTPFSSVSHCVAKIRAEKDDAKSRTGTPGAK